MWGYDSCFFWVTIEVSLQCTTNSSRARKTYSASNEKSDLGDIDFDLRCLECSFGRFTTYRDPAKWRELERTWFSRLQQCWTLLEWILLDHIRSTDPLSKSITVLADSVRHRGSMCTANCNRDDLPLREYLWVLVHRLLHLRQCPAEFFTRWCLSAWFDPAKSHEALEEKATNLG